MTTGCGVSTCRSPGGTDGPTRTSCVFQFIADATWNGLAKIYNTKQMLDLIFTVGNYHLNAMYTNSVGMPLAPGFGGLPAR